jgi:Ca2+-binding RTX toxin-like protein
MEFTDESAPLTVDPFGYPAGCAPFGADLRGLVCGPVDYLDAYLGNMDDELSNTSTNSGGRVWAGSGNDTVRIYSDAKAEAYGEGGNDTLTAGSHGGGGLADGGTGHDNITVNGFGPTALGGPGNDWLHLRPEFPAPASTLAGGSGDDHIWLEYSAYATAHGDDGADTVEVDPLDLRGWFSSFRMYGDAGPDTLIGGPSSDVMDGGDGRDTILATGGGADQITCGDGRDVVHADATDSVAPDCETVVVVSV